MKSLIGAAVLVVLFFLVGCGGSEPNTTEPASVPLTISKTRTNKVYVHMMPWFETPSSSSNGNWGSHWTMATKNPDVVVNGKADIASFYHPLTGPYASNDRDIIEMQLLMMKLSGVDGVLIDWYGTMNVNDYAANLRNTEAIIAMTAKVGLSYGIVYEDSVIQNVPNDDVKLAEAKADMRYLLEHSFSAPNYISFSGRPLLLVFGPQTFHTASAWEDIFSVLPNKPVFLTLWNSGVPADGEFAWIYQDKDTTNHQDHLDRFYAKPGVKMGSAYPGFKNFYKEGGWNNNADFVIEHNGTETFRSTLIKALDNVEYVQIATWNDYGEGTMIEPTFEFGFSFLTTMQATLGVKYSENELRLVARLYMLRKAHPTAELDDVFNSLVTLQFAKAQAVLQKLETQ